MAITPLVFLYEYIEDTDADIIHLGEVESWPETNRTVCDAVIHSDMLVYADQTVSGIAATCPYCRAERGLS